MQYREEVEIKQVMSISKTETRSFAVLDDIKKNYQFVSRFLIVHLAHNFMCDMWWFVHDWS